jgi:hypothetical protein
MKRVMSEYLQYGKYDVRSFSQYAQSLLCTALEHSIRSRRAHSINDVRRHSEGDILRDGQQFALNG